MVTLLEFAAELVISGIDLIAIFLTEVAFRDPLAFVSFLTGALLTTATVAFGGYLFVGAVLRELGISLPTPGRTPPQRGE